MASYTTELKVIIEQPTQYEEGLTLRDKIDIGRQLLFDFDYPFFDEDYKKKFETNFIRNFYQREIGFETEALFKFRLETWLNINMPYFNELFKSEQIKYDPLTNAQMLTAHEQMNDGNRKDNRTTNQTSDTEGQSTGTSNRDENETSNQSRNNNMERNENRNYNEEINIDSTENRDSETDTTESIFKRDIGSDNPDSRLQLTTNDGEGVIEYASKIDEEKSISNQLASQEENRESNEKQEQTGDSENKISQEDEGTTNEETNRNVSIDSEDSSIVNSNVEQEDVFERKMKDVEHFLQRRYGKIGADSYAKLIMEYRNALLRVELQIHREMQELFMLVY